MAFALELQVESVVLCVCVAVVVSTAQERGVMQPGATSQGLMQLECLAPAGYVATQAPVEVGCFEGGTWGQKESLV